MGVKLAIITKNSTNKIKNKIKFLKNFGGIGFLS